MAPIPGAKIVGSDECAECHPDQAQSFQQTTHAYMGLQCEQCHGEGSLHAADQGSKDINAFKNEPAAVANSICLACHKDQSRLHGWAASVHAQANLRCIDCHDVHRAQTAFNQRKADNQICLRCHLKQAAEINLPTHHPIAEGKVSCVDCHDPHQTTADGLEGSSANTLCYKCHAEYQGPFTYEHPPVQENCLNCHNPHGSVNDHLLKVSQPFLCLQCHSGHHDGTNIPLLNACTTCHSSIHGTDVPSATGGSVFIDKSSTAPATLAPLTARAANMRAETAAFSYGVPALAAATALNLNGTNSHQTVYSFQFAPTYRYLSVSGYGGRVGQYRSLRRNSLGGDLGIKAANRADRMVFDLRGSMTTPDDYDLSADLHLADTLTVHADAGSLIHNLETTPFGVNRSPDDIHRDQLIPVDTLLPIKKTFVNTRVRVHVPNTPVTFFVRGALQRRSGVCPAQYLDMGGTVDCAVCHTVSQIQNVCYETQDLAAGLDLKLGPAVITYEHARRTAENREPAPVDYFGGTISGPDDELPPGVADTLPGDYLHNVIAGHETNSDTLGLNLTPGKGITFNGTATYGRTRNDYTENEQKFLNTDNTLNWVATPRVNLGLDYHQQNIVDDYVPLYSLYGDPDIHRLWGGARCNCRLSDLVTVETYYRYTEVKRSSVDLWPQFYSPDNTDLQYLIPRTTANTLGAAVTVHKANRWKVRAGYEWTDTHEPGYLIDPGNASRILVSGSFSPATWLNVDEDLTVTLQSRFSNIDRSNDLYTSMTSLVFMPKSNWSLTVGYSYMRNDLKSDLVYMDDPGMPVLYQESLVPFDAVTQAVVVSSNLKVAKRLVWHLNLRSSTSKSGFTVDSSGAPDPFSLLSVQQAAAFSRIDIQQDLVDTLLTYPLSAGFQAGLGGEWANYRDLAHPDLTGHLIGGTLLLSESF